MRKPCHVALRSAMHAHTCATPAPAHAASPYCGCRMRMKICRKSRITCTQTALHGLMIEYPTQPARSSATACMCCTASGQEQELLCNCPWVPPSARQCGWRSRASPVPECIARRRLPGAAKHTVWFQLLLPKADRKAQTCCSYQREAAVFLQQIVGLPTAAAFAADANAAGPACERST